MLTRVAAASVTLAAAVCAAPAPAGATYSIAAVDRATGQVGGAGASCIGSESVRIIYGVAPGIGVVHAQAVVNEGARDQGSAETGELWRSGYDMTPAAIAAETDRLWGQVKPLYEQLHCYTRTRLGGAPPDRPPHLLRRTGRARRHRPGCLRVGA